MDLPSNLSASTRPDPSDPLVADSQNMASRAPDENDTCRICRGEGSSEEPLFFPCKCSGSIKYVHQECLMEWLSHSQKKHCELCKTSFRFTKLYDSTMPKHLPFLLFIRKATVHLFHALLTWLRAILVAAVWLFWLPWSMRFVWWGLFWIGDGSWTSDFQHIRSALDSDSPLRPIITPVSANLPSSTPQAFPISLTQKYYPSLAWLLPLKNFVSNSTVAIPRLVSGAFASLRKTNFSLLNNATSHTSTPPVDKTPISNDTSLLSYISFFHDLTPNPAFNKFVVDILEGQIITLAVVTAFILVFLIREWVVQQQPALHLGLIADDDINHDALIAAQGNLLQGNLNVPQNNEQQPQPPELPERGENTDGTEDDGASPRDESATAPETTPLSFSDVDPQVNEDDDHPDLYTPARSRPTMPMRSQSSLATNIQRDLQETASSSNIPNGSLGLDDEATISSASVDQRIQSSSDALNPDIDSATSEDSLLPLQPPLNDQQPETQVSDLTGDTPAQDQQPATAPLIRIDGPVFMVDISSEASAPSENRGTDVEGFPNQDVSPQAASDPEAGDSSPEGQRVTEDPARNDSVDQIFEETPQPDDPANSHERPPEQEEEVLPHHQASLYERMLNWMFADIARDGQQDREPAENDERVVNDVAEEPPFVRVVEARPRNRGDQRNLADNNQQADPEPEVVQAANNNFNEAEPQEEVEDLEGVLELIGMQGPLASLFQNAVFCAVLISATVTSAVWFPYLCGKMVLIFMAHPVQLIFKAPLHFVSTCANFAIDLSLFVGFKALFGLYHALHVSLSTISWLFPGLLDRIGQQSTRSTLADIPESALRRMVATISSFGIGQGAPTLQLSLSSLAALRLVQGQIRTLMSNLTSLFGQFYGFTTALVHESALPNDAAVIFRVASTGVLRCTSYVSEISKDLLRLSKTGDFSMSINLSLPSIESGSKLADWSPADRLTTVSLGYAFFAVMGGLYLHRGAPFSTSQQGRKVERVITEILRQSGGVLKVILIISIEMILFPLYCGMLLDLAMLPLFQANIDSRIAYSAKAPWTSAFIHWFLGTCYMFHFALFVSMCRKIFRSGVLYFIRDPDDPTFHPVRDVLERSVSSQLRKIGFSALVYGALVTVCMGSVIWGIALSFDGIFPLAWKSEAPPLGFPVDILLYNLLAPLAIQFFRPAKGLKTLYDWWFRYCAEKLRLTNFLFDYTDNETSRQPEHAEDAHTGRYVRAPASDQVRIPKGHRVFLEVDQNNNRLDGKEDTEEGPHGRSNPHYTKVWIPPWYRTRIAFFVFFVWALTAFVGVSVTLLPLLLGRSVLAALFQGKQRLNDVYAFSAGGCIVGALAYAIFRLRHTMKITKITARFDASFVSQVSDSLNAIGIRVLRVLYTYSALCIYVPALIALLIESYIIMPLHTYISMGQTSNTANSQLSDPSTAHTMSFLQDCTLGLLYLRVFLRLLLWNPNTRPARALHAIVSAGWLNPNAKIATKCFILPFTVFTLLALTVPPILGIGAYKLLPFTVAKLQPVQVIDSLFPTLITRLLEMESKAQMIYMIRFSYPALLSTVFNVWVLWLLGKAAGRWKSRIKDEVYLIGERLHNFGERRPPDTNNTAREIRAHE